MADDEVEQTLLIIRECHVYKIPPRTTAAGYKYGQSLMHNNSDISVWSGKYFSALLAVSCLRLFLYLKC